MKRIIILFCAGICCIPGALKAQTTNDGLRAFDFDKFEEAKSIFLNLVKNDPKGAAENYYWLGQVYTSVQNTDSAYIAYTLGVAANNSVGMNYAGLGELKLMENKLAEAELEFAKALKFTKEKDIKTMRAISSAYLNGGTQYTDKALEYANKAIAIRKNDNENFILLGDIYLKKQDGGNAATNYELSIYFNPKDPKPHVRVANIWLQVKNADRTIESLNKALELDSNYAPAHKGLSRYYYITKQYNKAKAEYNKYLDLSERSIANQRQFVNILFLGGFYADALEIIDYIRSIDSSDIYLYRLKAYSIYEVGVEKKIDSTEYYKPGIALIEYFLTNAKPEKIIPSDYIYHARLTSKAGMDSLAIVRYLKALEMDTTQADIYLEVGKLKNKQRNYSEAAEYMQKGINKQEKPSLVDYYLLARAYYFSKQYGKADTAYSKVTDAKPDFADAWYWRGVCNATLDPDFKDTIAKGHYLEFIKLAEADVQKNKKNLLDAYYYVGIFYIKRDDNTTAKTYFEKMLAIDPENANAKEVMKGLK